MFKEARIQGGMFADCMLDASWTHGSHRGWTTLTSFGLQAVAIGVLLLLPLLKSAGVPVVRRTVSLPISDAGPAPEPVRRRASRGTSPQVSPNVAHFVAPGRVPPTIVMTDDGMRPPEFGEPCSAGCDTNLPGTAPGVQEFPILLSGNWSALPTPPMPAHPSFRTSRMLEGSLVRRVRPDYPPLARAARIQGEVVLFAIIGKQGMIENLRVLRGHPMLVAAAIEAVRQWRYRPYILNGEPIEVETEITVNFTLN